jgi:hypothetical protein
MAKQPFDQGQLKIASRVQAATAKIGIITRDKINEFTKDVAGMASALYAKTFRNRAALAVHSRPRKRTGTLEKSVRAESAQNATSKINAAVVATATNKDGHGYALAVEWGHKPVKPKGATAKRRTKKNKASKKLVKTKGAHAMLRATFGIIGRWKRGNRWKA